MAKQNKTQFVILGMLSSGPKSGYAIRKSMQQSTQNFWYESNGQLYPALARLCDDGAIKEAASSLGDTSKKVYRITALGKKIFTAWLEQDVDYQPLRNELLLKLFFGDEADGATSIKMLQKHKAILEDKLKMSKSVAAMLQKATDAGEYPIFYLLTVKFGISAIAAEIKWSIDSMQQIVQHSKK